MPALWLLLAFLLPAAALAEPPPAARTYRTMMSSDTRSLDPISFWQAAILLSMYETLYEYEYLSDPLTVRPLLAASLPKVAKKGLQVTIPLRKGIRFWDDPCFRATQGKGRELVADDVAFMLKRLAVPSLAQGWWLVDGKIAGINALRDRLKGSAKKDYLKILREPMEGIRVLDPHTIQLTLTKPYPQLAHALAVMVAAVVPWEAVEAYGSPDGEVIDHPVGSGPFRLKAYERGQRLLLDRNPGYHPDFYPTKATGRFAKGDYLRDQGKKLPLVDHVQIEILREEGTAWLKFLAGQLDVIRAPKEQLHLLARDGNAFRVQGELAQKNVVADVGPSNGIVTLEFNLKDPLLGGNKLLRQAISSAIDRDAWNAHFYEKLAVTANSPLPQGVEGRPDDETLKYGFDPERAKALLAKAGYPDGKGLPPIDLELGEPGTTHRQLAELLTRQLARVGIPVKPSMSLQPVFHQKREAAQLQLFLGGWTLDYPDPENLYSILYGPNRSPGTNASNFANAEFDKLYLEMASMAPSAARSKLIRKMDAIVQEEVPWVLVLYPSNVHFLQPRLRNYRYDEILWAHLKYVSVGE